MSYLIETKETFSCTYFCNKQNCPIEMNKENGRPWKSTTNKMEARQKERKKNIETHCVRTDLLGHFLEADF